MVAQAILHLAAVYYMEGNLETCLATYERLAGAAFSSPDLWEYREAGAKGFVDKSLEKAQKEINEHDPRVAVKTYRALIEYDENIVEAHRGLIALYSALKENDKAVAYYRKKILLFFPVNRV